MNTKRRVSLKLVWLAIASFVIALFVVRAVTFVVLGFAGVDLGAAEFHFVWGFIFLAAAAIAALVTRIAVSPRFTRSR